jgi:hypothetical protein
MMQLLIKYGNIALTTTTIPQARYPSCLLLLVRLRGYIANLSTFIFTDSSGNLVSVLILLNMEEAATLLRRNNMHVLRENKQGNLRASFP